MNDKTLVELKAMAYDAICQKEFWQMQLQKINAAITEKINAEADTKTTTTN
jgi:hypothetical protein